MVNKGTTQKDCCQLLQQDFTQGSFLSHTALLRVRKITKKIFFQKKFPLLPNFSSLDS